MSEQVTTKVLEEHKREYQNIKTAGPPSIKPTGTLLSTFYEHTGPVNSIAVTDNQELFMTGSRADRKIHVWSVARNITEDASSQSIYDFETKTSLNQICFVSNSNTLAAATEQGIELHDLSKLKIQQVFEDHSIKQLDFNEVLQVKSMQSPITY